MIKKITCDLIITNVNLVQKACYNRHYGFNSLQVNAALQANEIRHTYCESLRRYDYMALHRISMIEMIKELKTEPYISGFTLP